MLFHLWSRWIHPMGIHKLFTNCYRSISGALEPYNQGCHFWWAYLTVLFSLFQSRPYLHDITEEVNATCDLRQLFLIGRLIRYAEDSVGKFWNLRHFVEESERDRKGNCVRKRVTLYTFLTESCHSGICKSVHPTPPTHIPTSTSVPLSVHLSIHTYVQHIRTTTYTVHSPTHGLIHSPIYQLNNK